MIAQVFLLFVISALGSRWGLPIRCTTRDWGRSQTICSPSLMGGIYHRQHSNWLHKFFCYLSPGHLDPGEDFRQAALRETGRSWTICSPSLGGGGGVMRGGAFISDNTVIDCTSFSVICHQGTWIQVKTFDKLHYERQEEAGLSAHHPLGGGGIYWSGSIYERQHGNWLHKFCLAWTEFSKRLCDHSFCT